MAKKNNLSAIKPSWVISTTPQQTADNVVRHTGFRTDHEATLRPKKAEKASLVKGGTNTQNQFRCSPCMFSPPSPTPSLSLPLPPVLLFLFFSLPCSLSFSPSLTHICEALPISFWNRQWAITCSISPGLRWSNLTWACWTTLTSERLHVSVCVWGGGVYALQDQESLMWTVAALLWYFCGESVSRYENYPNYPVYF